jgi:hypothetical protein
MALHCCSLQLVYVGAMGLSGWRRCPLVAKVSLALVQPSLLIGYGKRIQVLRSRACIVHPVPEQRTAVDDIDGKLALLVLVGEIAPERIVGIQPANSFESERLGTPGLERLMIVVTFRMNLHAVAQLADMFVKRGFEPAIAQAATTKPLRRSFMTARASISGAPNTSSGRVVPRPSESVVPSSITVPA